MTPLDPFTLRTNQRIEDERDRLRERVEELEEDRRRVIVCAQNLLAENRRLNERIVALRLEGLLNERAAETAEA